MKFITTMMLCLVFVPISYADTVIIRTAAEPPNLSSLKKQIVAYHDSGKYEKDISQAIRKAMYYLRFRINENHRLKKSRRLAVVLDIDETALSNYANLKRLDFGGTEGEMSAAQVAANEQAISSTHTLYRYASNHGVSVFFITGRRESKRKITVMNLNSAGYINWQALYMKPNDYHQSSVVAYKKAIRKKISDMGYDIVLNIGDQESDLKGGYADMAFKLPNPYYNVM